MRMHLNRLGVAAGVIVLTVAFGPVAGVSAASAAADAPRVPTLKVAEEGLGRLDFRFIPEALSGEVRTFREQCVAHSDGRHFEAHPFTQLTVSVTRLADAECDKRPTQSTWFLSVNRPDRFKGMITFSLSQDMPGGSYKIRCEESTGNVECREDRQDARKILIETR